MYHGRSTVQLISGELLRVVLRVYGQLPLVNYSPAIMFTSLGAIWWVIACLQEANKPFIPFISATYHWKSLQGLTTFKCINQNQVSGVLLNNNSSYVFIEKDLSAI